jgi:hypothetical protein
LDLGAERKALAARILDDPLHRLRSLAGIEAAIVAVLADVFDNPRWPALAARTPWTFQLHHVRGTHSRRIEAGKQHAIGSGHRLVAGVADRNLDVEFLRRGVVDQTARDEFQAARITRYFECELDAARSIRAAIVAGR